MCGRITLRNPEGAVAVFLGRAVAGLPAPRFNIGPGQESAVIRASSEKPGELVFENLNWAFVPHWSREEKPVPIINARSETVGERPSFRDAFRKRRCLVLADGFYEWQKSDLGRLPYLCGLKEDAPFAIAGIWESWRRADREERGFCLLTTSPNELMKPIHDRMPVLLDVEGARRWLMPGFGEELKELFRPFPAERMVVRRVDTYVNKIGNEGPECIASPSDGDQLPLF